MDKGSVAFENFNSGLNCSQAVVLAFKEQLDLDETVLKKLSIGFGGGLGRQRLTCGAVSGMCMVISALKSDGVDKLAIYSVIKDACDEFKNVAGSLICADLLQSQKLACAQMCRLAAEIAQKYVK